MEAMELYALATQMADDLREGREGREARRSEAADLFPMLEYLWERGVDLTPALAPRRATRVAEAG